MQLDTETLFAYLQFQNQISVNPSKGLSFFPEIFSDYLDYFCELKNDNT